MTSDIHDWRITFVDTGLTSNIGQRLKAVEKHVADEPEFLANYSDGLTNLSLPEHVAHFRDHDAVASFLSVRPNLSIHFVTAEKGGRVTAIQDVRRFPIRINGGYFIFRREIFEHIGDGEELVCEPFQKLIESRQLVAYEHDDFWMCMDTFKDRQQLEEIYARGGAPWQVWNGHGAPSAEACAGAYI